MNIGPGRPITRVTRASGRERPNPGTIFYSFPVTFLLTGNFFWGTFEQSIQSVYYVCYYETHERRHEKSDP